MRPPPGAASVPSGRQTVLGLDVVRKTVQVALVGLLLTMSSCTFLKDALVSNPCDSSVRVRLSGRGSPPSRVEDWNVTVHVAPKATVRVADAFLDAPDEELETFFAQVSIPGKNPMILRVRESENPVPVKIPVHYCR